MNLGRLQDTRSIYKNYLYFYNKQLEIKINKTIFKIVSKYEILRDENRRQSKCLSINEWINNLQYI